MLLSRLFKKIESAYSSLVDKEDYDYPEFELSKDKKVLIMREVWGQVPVSAQFTRTKKGWVGLYLKDGKAFDDRTFKTADDAIWHASYVFHTDFYKRDEKKFKDLVLSDPRPDDYRKALRVINKLYHKSNLVTLLADLNVLMATKGVDKSVIASYQNRIKKLVKDTQQFKGSIPEFYIHPLNYIIPLTPSPGEMPKKAQQKIYDYFEEEAALALKEAHDMFGVIQE